VIFLEDSARLSHLHFICVCSKKQAKRLIWPWTPRTLRLGGWELAMQSANRKAQSSTATALLRPDVYAVISNSRSVRSKASALSGRCGANVVKPGSVNRLKPSTSLGSPCFRPRHLVNRRAQCIARGLFLVLSWVAQRHRARNSCDQTGPCVEG
jgi:hypothetical protein